MATTDPLTLGQRLVAVLEGGQRTATYKLAVMVALLDLAVESVPDDPEAAVSIDLDDLAHRVMDLYWRQLRPLDGEVLRQSNDGRGVVFAAVSRLRAAVASSNLRETPIETAAIRAPRVYETEKLVVKRNLVRYPLHLLQRVGSTHECFLYDDAWLGTDSLRLIDQHDNAIELLPGVCFTLARLAPLVKPAFQLAWVDDVRRMNRALFDDEPDLAHHLFGADRVALQKPGFVLGDAFGRECFYCASHLTSGQHVDHVLPWSRVGLDGLSNLVLACSLCNTNKSDLLPDPAHIRRALGRGRDRLDALAESINWPSQFDRVVAAAHGLYATQPDTTPIWRATKRVDPLSRVDIVWPAL
ncbi:HNH endonuclease signature motif containing protein [Gordonia sp. NPDC003585]|uniref:HNH endonuclease signature motif containing protein n=1 Tax=Gordonia sp. NPDC003585 TaxID=3154275 RepID=UPI00339F6C52